MCSRKWVVVFAIAALAACATARPGDTDVIESSKISNEISSTEVTTKPEAAQPETAQTVTAQTEAAQAEAKASDDENTLSSGRKPEAAVVEAHSEVEPTADVTEQAPAAATTPVNEQYPQAVLFGGTCGGTIISPNWVISAGHCTIFTSARYVLAGTNNTENDSGVRRRIKRLVIHPRFSVGPYWLDAKRFHLNQVAANWDFLLAELAEPLPLDGKTMVAAELDDGPSIPEGLNVGYAGYGAESHGMFMREDMHGMELRVMPDSKCKEALEQYEPEHMICTQGRPPRLDSACNGDSGSGLVANGKLYGVASWVQDDATRCFNGALVVFSRVSAVRDWIRQVTGV